MKPPNRNYEKRARKFYSLVYGLIAGALFLMLTLSCGKNDDTSFGNKFAFGDKFENKPDYKDNRRIYRDTYNYVLTYEEK